MRNPRIGGNTINYYYHCKTQLWFYIHNITMEDTSEYVKLGKLLHENYNEGEEKDLLLDEIKLDIIREEKEIVEIKRSTKIKENHIAQVKYYLYYLEKKMGLHGYNGRLTYPRIHKTLEIHLNNEDKEKMKSILEDIKKYFYLSKLPEPVHKEKCKNCSYFELCFS